MRVGESKPGERFFWVFRLLESLTHPNSSISELHIYTVFTGIANNLVSRQLCIEHVLNMWKQASEDEYYRESFLSLILRANEQKNSVEDLAMVIALLPDDFELQEHILLTIVMEFIHFTDLQVGGHGESAKQGYI